MIGYQQILTYSGPRTLLVTLDKSRKSNSSVNNLNESAPAYIPMEWLKSNGRIKFYREYCN